MGRLHTIVEKLNKELNADASAAQMLHTSKMLLLELESMSKAVLDLGEHKSTIAINTVYPVVSKEERIEIAEEPEIERVEEVVELVEELHDAELKQTQEPAKEATKAPSYDELEKEFSVLNVDEKEVAAELDQLKNHQPVKNYSLPKKPEILLFDPVDDIPTLRHQSLNQELTVSELNEKMRTNDEKPSINDILKKETNEVSNSLSNEPIKDLKKGIGLNDTYLFINELFRGDETMYTRSIKTINGFSNFAEAQFWIERELKLKLGWVNADAVVKHFDQLIRRRFS